jgi:hypothetical protein
MTTASRLHLTIWHHGHRTPDMRKKRLDQEGMSLRG